MIDDTATELAARPRPDRSTMMTTSHVRSGQARSGTSGAGGGYNASEGRGDDGVSAGSGSDAAG